MALQVRPQISLVIVALGVFLLGATGCSTPRGASLGITQILEQADEYYDPVPGPGDLTDSAPSHPQVREELRHVQMLWPLRALRITSAFGGRWGRRHAGVDLRARRGTPVLAALSGIVAFAGSRLSGYGEMLIVKHAWGLSTVYAHNSKLLVKTGDLVKRGQTIALSGQTGEATAPHLHFEVRDRGEPQDPLWFLPARLP